MQPGRFEHWTSAKKTKVKGLNPLRQMAPRVATDRIMRSGYGKTSDWDCDPAKQGGPTKVGPPQENRP